MMPDDRSTLEFERRTDPDRLANWAAAVGREYE
jgi:hypothetical protein